MTAMQDALVPTELVPAPIIVTTERRNLTRDEAVSLTEEIRRNANRLWLLVAEAYDRNAYRALGYPDWKSYVTTELGISEAQSYNLVDVGKVMRTIVEATGVDPNALEPVPIRTVRRVKTNLAGLKRAIKAGLEHGGELATVIPLALEEVAPRPDGGSRREPHHPAGPRVDEVTCPVCLGTGSLGVGKRARELAERAENWLKRYVR